MRLPVVRGAAARLPRKNIFGDLKTFYFLDLPYSWGAFKGIKSSKLKEILVSTS